MARARIAKTGGTIADSSRSLALDTNFTSLMILNQAQVSGATTSVAHNLGYNPIVYSFFHDGSYWHASRSFGVAYSDISVDTSNIYIENGSGYTWYYFLIGNAVDNATGTGNNNATGKFKVVKSGYNISTATDIRQYQFCSGSDLFKADTGKKGTTSVTTSSSNWNPIATIPHNLGYVPFCLVSDSDFGGEIPLEYGDGLWNYYYYMDSTNLYVQVSDLDMTSPATYNFKYQIYRNKIG